MVMDQHLLFAFATKDALLWVTAALTIIQLVLVSQVLSTLRTGTNIVYRNVVTIL